jgi:hypothetical protein
MGLLSPRLERLAGQLGQESSLRASSIGFYKLRKQIAAGARTRRESGENKRAATCPRQKRTLGALNLVSWSAVSFCFVALVGICWGLRGMGKLPWCMRSHTGESDVAGIAEVAEDALLSRSQPHYYYYYCGETAIVVGS